MDYFDTIMADPRVEFVLRDSRFTRKPNYRDLEAAYRLFAELNAKKSSAAARRLDGVFTMCRYMEPEIEDVIALLLYPDCRFVSKVESLFLKFFSEKRYQRYLDHIASAWEKGNETEEVAAGDAVRYHIMHRVCGKTITALVRRMNKMGLSSTIMVLRAYELAQAVYQDRYGEHGEPCLADLVAIAQILVEHGADSYTAAAGLLHRIFIDSDCDGEAVAKRVCDKVAERVSAAMAFDEKYVKYCGPFDGGVDSEPDETRVMSLLRMTAGEVDVRELVAMGAAKQIRILSGADSEEDKSAENITDYLALTRALRMESLSRRIDDLKWRLTDMTRYDATKQRYGDMLAKNRECIEGMRGLLQENLALWPHPDFPMLDHIRYRIEIQEREYTPYEVCRLASSGSRRRFEPERSVNKANIPLCDMEISVFSVEHDRTADDYISVFAKVFESKIAITGRVIADCYTAESGALIFEVEDRYRNVFRCCIQMCYETAEEDEPEGLPSDMNEEVTQGGGVICVRTSEDQPIVLPQGATVIDFAFYIHEEVGLCLKGATVNGKKVPIYTVLQEGDHVVVDTMTKREKGVTTLFEPCFSITWLNHVVTKFARKKLIERTAERYEGDNVRRELEAEDGAVDKVASAILKNLRFES